MRPMHFSSLPCTKDPQTIVKEALACDIPVVSVDVGDVRDLIKGLEGCYLALPQPSDLAAKLRLVFAVRIELQGV